MIKGKGKGYAVEEVGQKGEVVIGDEFLEELGVEPGWRAFQFKGEDHVKIYFAPPKDYEELAGSLAKYVTEENKFDDDDWHKIKEKAWAEYVKEKYSELK